MEKLFSVRIIILTGSLCLQLSTLCFHARGAAGDVDLSFDPGAGINGPVNVMIVQPDGKVIIGGYTTTEEGIQNSVVARLNANGTLDSSFNAGTRASDGVYVSAIALQSDGKMLVGQEYGVTRLNSNGDRDSSFNLYAVGGDYTGATSLTVQPDGKVLVGGYTVTHTYDPEGYVDYFFSYFVTRVHANGSRDTSFEPVLGNPLHGGGEPVRALAVQSDGKIVVGGTPSLNLGTNQHGIARLNANGSLDSSFYPGPGSLGIVESLALQQDGKVLVGGRYIGSDTNRNAIARLNTNGSLDSSFYPGIGMGGVYPWVESVVVQPNGKVLIAGYFTSVNGTNRNHIARLNSNGSLDNSFDPCTGADQPVRSIALQADGKALISGDFFIVNGVIRPYLARLYGDSFPPSLNVARSNAFMIISWPVAGLNFQLQESTNLALPNSWLPVAQSAVTNTGQVSVTVPTTVGRKFFRLKSQ
jgi:uncharacterized delta-60 repeat protein